MATFNPFDPRTALILGVGQGLLQQGGWSPAPVSFGQAAGAGLNQGMQNYRTAYLMKQAEDARKIEEGYQRARIAKMEREAAQAEAARRYVASLPEGERLRAEAMGVPEYIKTATAQPKAPSTRKRALPGGMVQDEEFVSGQWRPVGEPYARRDPYLQVQGTDEQGRPVTQLIPRSDIQAQIEGAEGPELRRVTVATGEKKKPSKEQTMLMANTRAALEDIETARSILFTPEGALNREATTKGIMGLPGTEGRTGYQALRRAVEVLLRARTGAAAPAQEVDTYMRLYAPSPLDSDEGARKKMEQLQGIFKDTVDIFESGGFEWQGGETPGVLPVPEQAATAPTTTVSPETNIGALSDMEFLMTDTTKLTDEQKKAFDKRLKAMGF